MCDYDYVLLQSEKERARAGGGNANREERERGKEGRQKAGGRRGEEVRIWQKEKKRVEGEGYYEGTLASDQLRREVYMLCTCRCVKKRQGWARRKAKARRSERGTDYFVARSLFVVRCW